MFILFANLKLPIMVRFLYIWSSQSKFRLKHVYTKRILQAAERFLDPSLQTELYMSLVKLIILEENQVLILFISHG